MTEQTNKMINIIVNYFLDDYNQITAALKY